MTAEQLTGLDASFLYVETPTLHMQVAMTAVFDPGTVPGGYSFERLRRVLKDRIVASPVFTRKLVEVPLRLGHPVWAEDPEFDIDNHLHRAALPDPGGGEELADFTAEVMSRKLDRTHPLWEMWVIEGVTGGRIALTTKLHHSTIDGISGAELLAILLDLEANPSTPPTLPVKAEVAPAPSSVDLLGRAMLQRLSMPFDVAKTVVKTGGRFFGMRRVRYEGNQRGALPLTAPRTSINRAIVSRRRVAFAAANLADVKALKHALGVTVNDLVLGICTGALRRYLLDREELPDDPLVAVIPVSVGSEGTGGENQGANQVSAMFVELPTHVADPLEQIRIIHEGTKAAKQEHQALGGETLQNLAQHAAPNVFSLSARMYTKMRLADRHRPIANLVISNVPGPDFPLFLGGCEMLAGFPLGPVVDGMGLNITIISYRGVLYWGLIACAKAVPRLWDLAGVIPEAFSELMESVGVSPHPLDLRVDIGPALAHADLLGTKGHPSLGVMASRSGGPRSTNGRANGRSSSAKPTSSAKATRKTAGSSPRRKATATKRGTRNLRPVADPEKEGTSEDDTAQRSD